jgi:hypothetical protein
MIKTLLQKAANLLVKKLEEALEADDMVAFNFFLENAYWLDDFSISVFNIYLD